MKTFREWLREGELNEAKWQVDLKKYFKNPEYPQDKFRKEIDKELSKIFKDYYASEEDIKKSVKSDMFLVTAHQLKNNKSIVEDRVYMCNTSPIGIANFKGDIILTELLSGKKVKFELGNGINDRLQLLDKERPVSIYYEITAAEQWNQEISNIFVGNVFITSKEGKMKDIDFKGYPNQIFNNLRDKDYDSIDKMLNDRIKTVIELVK